MSNARSPVRQQAAYDCQFLILRSERHLLMFPHHWILHAEQTHKTTSIIKHGFSSVNLTNDVWCVSLKILYSFFATNFSNCHFKNWRWASAHVISLYERNITWTFGYYVVVVQFKNIKNNLIVQDTWSKYYFYSIMWDVYVDFNVSFISRFLFHILQVFWLDFKNWFNTFLFAAIIRWSDKRSYLNILYCTWIINLSSQWSFLNIYHLWDIWHLCSLQQQKWQHTYINSTCNAYMLVKTVSFFSKFLF